MPNDIAKEILDLVLTNNNKINYPEYCYEIKLLDIFEILKEMSPTSKFIIQSGTNSFEKYIEDINEDITILKLTKIELKRKLQNIIYH